MKTKFAALIIVGLSLGLSHPVLAAPQVTLTWKDNSNNEDGFSVERRLATDPVTAFKEIGTLGPNVVFYVDTTVVAGTLYCYRVKAFSTVGGSSAYTNEACLVASPSGLTIISIP